MTKPDLVPEPSTRNLRIFAFDPGISAQYGQADINEITVAIPWETNLLPGPVGEYVEVVDVDPASSAFYKPVDLNDPRLLAQNGLSPSETNPQFHQQMVYAVAMTTILNFERALGRVALWSSWSSRVVSRSPLKDDRTSIEEYFVRRLRIYPHALIQNNAYYSPAKKALLLGYFSVGLKDEYNTPGTRVYACLSHDIVAHETTHALLDGVHPRFNKPMNQDVLAFHEAFADIVALFQHFAYPSVLRDQIARTRGNLATENLLGELAQQFGKATGRGRALRNYLGEEDPTTHEWKPIQPDVHKLDNLPEAHDRGAVLVAAVFGAFLKIYRSSTLDLYRIASDGTGVLREGDIHPDLVNRLATEAARSAQQVLQTCIRAIDYCPPVNITFGDYLRAIVTSDYELNADDTKNYRLAFVESFRQWGIHPVGITSMSLEALLWPTGDQAAEEAGVDPVNPADLVSLLNDQHPFDEAAQGRKQRQSSSTSRSNPNQFTPWTLDSDRYDTWVGVGNNASVLWTWLVGNKRTDLARAIGIELDEANMPPTALFYSNSPQSYNQPTVRVEVTSVRTAIRRSPRGAPTTDLVVEVTQRRRGYFDKATQEKNDTPGAAPPADYGDFRFYAGCTLFFNPATMEVRRVIRTPGTVTDNTQLELMRRFLTEDGLPPHNAFNFAADALNAPEPFALVHGVMEIEQDVKEARDRQSSDH